MIISILAKSSNYKPVFLVEGINHVNPKTYEKYISASIKCNYLLAINYLHEN